MKPPRNRHSPFRSAAAPSFHMRRLLAAPAFACFMLAWGVAAVPAPALPGLVLNVECAARQAQPGDAYQCWWVSGPADVTEPMHEEALPALQKLGALVSADMADGMDEGVRVPLPPRSLASHAAPITLLCLIVLFPAAAVC